MGRHRIFNNRRNLDASILILAEEEVMLRGNKKQTLKKHYSSVQEIYEK